MSERDFKSKEPLRDNHKSNNFLPGIAIGVLSTLVLVMGGYIAYQFFNNKKPQTAAKPNEPTSIANNTSQTTLNNGNTASLPTQPNFTDSNIETTNSSIAIATQEIQPGQYVQPAFVNKAEVELLKVNLIND
ncbi:MAG: hypothetical protein ACRC11_18810 [Xenococcaceae cyanobacterium]